MLKIITLFTGIGAQEAALKRLNIPFEVVGISEIDKYAIQSYNAINGPTFNYGDITKIPMLDYADLWTYSFPCQDLSVAGMQKGINEGTRSGLLLHVERLLELSVLMGNQPKYLLLENVKNLVGKKFKPDFDKWLNKLESLGYNNYWQVLNAKDYNIPQNRERVFVVSIRKDVDTKGYKFPEKVPLTRRLKDVLESEVNEKYYLSDKTIKGFLKTTEKQLAKNHGFIFKPTDGNVVAKTLTTKPGQRTVDNYINEPLACASRGRNPDNPSDRTIGIPTEQRLEVNYNGWSNTLTTVEKDNYIIQRTHGFNKGNIFDKAPTLTANGKYQDNNVIIQLGNIVDTGNWDNPQRGRIYSPNGCSPALNTCQGGGLEPKILEDFYANREVREYEETSPTLRSERVGLKVNEGYRIRKLTPLECWRLMDFTDDEFYSAQFSGVSNSQLYKQAGNSICVGVLAGIFKELLA